MSDITEDQFWNTLNEPEPEIEIFHTFKIYYWYNEQNKIHRENDLPAEIWYCKDRFIYRKIWYQNGKMHRVDGPAMIWYHSNSNGNIEEEYWYLNGEEYTEENYWKKLKELGYE